MPGPHADGDERIIVHDRRSNGLPFSRGIMATSLLATGIRTEEAYRLASLVQRELLDRGSREVGAEELVALTHATLSSHAEDTQIADRWTAWRRAKRSGRPVVISLGGAAGTGKSTMATRLAVRLDITRVVTTDAIRDVLRTVVPDVVLPELHVSTFEAVDPVAPDPFAGFDRQCRAVGAAAVAVADRIADEHRSVIVEGVHLLPGEMTVALAEHPAAPLVVERLIVQASSERHADLLQRREVTEPLRRGARHLAGFDRIRSIQDHLVDAAGRFGVRVVDGGAAGDLTQDIVDEIVDRLADAPPAGTSTGGAAP